MSDSQVAFFPRTDSEKRLYRALEKMAGEACTAKSVTRILKRLDPDACRELGWLAVTKRGRKVLCRAFARVHEAHVSELLRATRRGRRRTRK